MKTALRVLHLEDDLRDAELVEETLATDGFTSQITRVETEPDFIALLEQGSFDLILADYTLPSFDGVSALKIAQQRWPHVPFIFVAGTLGEDVAIEALKIGATDYVLKTRLSGLVPSVKRALRESHERTELSRAENALQRSEAYLAQAQRLSHTGSFGWDVSGGEIYWSQETFRIFEFEPGTKVTIERIVQRTHPEDRVAVQQLIERVSRERQPFDIEHRLLMPDGSVKYLRVVGHPSTSESGRFEFVGAVTDITDGKRADALLTGEKGVLEMIATGVALTEILNRLCLIIEEQRSGMLSSVLLLDEDGAHLQPMASPSLPEGWTRMIAGLRIGPNIGSCGSAAYRRERVIVSDIATDPLWAIEPFRTSALSFGLRACWSNPILSSQGKVLGTFAMYYTEVRSPSPQDIELIELATHLARVAIERDRGEEALRRSESFLAEGEAISNTGTWGWNLATGKIVWSKEQALMLGFNHEATQPSVDLFLEKLHPQDRQRVWQTIDSATKERRPYEVEYRVGVRPESVKHFRTVGKPVVRFSGEVNEYIGVTVDISESKRGEALFTGERRLLEMIATGVPLQEILNVLCLTIEEYRSGTLASVLLLNPDKIHLTSVAGPNLPADWIQQMEKLPIGPCAGSCGTAAYRRSPVIVSNIETDPLWEVPEHRAAALSHGLQASWSNPIVSSKGEVLGTFCLYYRETRSPNSHDLEVIEMATHLARIAIERDRAQDALRTSEQKYRDLINTSPDAIYVIDTDGKCVLSNTAGAELAGRSMNELIGSSISDTYLPDERHLVSQRLDSLKTEGSQLFERKFLRNNGDVVPVEVSLSALRNRYCQAIVRDISERKRSENALRASEQVARGQVEALAHSLSVLAKAPDPEKLIGQMLSAIGRLINAQKVALWLFDEATDTLVLRLMADGTKAIPPEPQHPLRKNAWTWKDNPMIQELILTAAPLICDDVETDPRVDSEWREYLKQKGTKKFLAVPILVTGQVKGFIGIRHANLVPYRPEEIELTQALAHQVMLALQLNELAEQGRRAAVFEERNRLARDIHDTLAQGFTGVIVQLEAAEDAISCDRRAEADDHLRRASQLARRSLSEARRSVHALRPQVLQEYNFWDALKGVIRNTTVGTALRTTFAVQGTVPELPRAWQENLLHIGQEALTNTLKYARARNFETRLSCWESKLRLELFDNGDGFEVNDRHDGMGLTGMRERVEQMGGELKVTSSRRKGTKITVVLPYNGESVS